MTGAQFVSANEYQSMAFYLESSKLSGPFETTFWTQYVPQISHCDPAVHHAVIALSTFHRGREDNVQPPNAQTAHSDYRKFALEHYGMAMQAVQSRASRDDEDSLRGVLISCLLFTILECLMGNYESGALIHLRNGLDILGNLRSASASKGAGCAHSASDSAKVEEHLVHLFAELELKAAFLLRSRRDEIFGHSRRQRLCIPLESRTDLYSLSEASHELEDTISATYDFNRWSIPIRQAITPSGNKELRQRYAVVNARVEQYSAAFQRFLSRTQSDFTRDELHGAVELKIKEKFARLMLDTTLLQPDNLDQLTHQHESLLKMIGSLIETSTAKATGSASSEEQEKRAVGSIGAGIGIPLLFIIQRCACKALRSKAVELLPRFPRREGFWDSAIVSEIARQLQSFHETKKGSSLALTQVLLENMSPEERSGMLEVRTGLDGSTVVLQESIRW